MGQAIAFYTVAAAILAFAVLVITARNTVHSVLFLVANFLFVAGLYVLLGAQFLAVIQVVVYVGAIAILVIFAVMLTRRVMKDTGPQSNRNWWLGALISVILLGGIVLILVNWQGFMTTAPELTNSSGSISQLGLALVSADQYVLPFELASVLLVAAMIGAIFVAGEKKS